MGNSFRPANSSSSSSNYIDKKKWIVFQHTNSDEGGRPPVVTRYLISKTPKVQFDACPILKNEDNSIYGTKIGSTIPSAGRVVAMAVDKRGMSKNDSDAMLCCWFLTCTSIRNGDHEYELHCILTFQWVAPFQRLQQYLFLVMLLPS